MNLTPEEFEARSFFLLSEMQEAVPGIPARRLRQWLDRANVTERNAGGAIIVTRHRLEVTFPELLEALRRCVRANHK